MEKTLTELLAQFLRSLSIKEFVRELRGAKVRRLNEALEDKRLCPIARELLEEELSITRTRQAMGLYADRFKREKLRDLIHMSAGELRQSEVALASPRLIVRKGKVVPDFDAAATLPMHAGTVIGLGIMWLGALILMAPLLLRIFGVNFGTVGGLVVMGGGMLAMMFSVFLMREMEPRRAAYRIAGTLEELQREPLEG